MPAAAPPPPAVPRRVGGLSGIVLGLGSMGLGVGATAVVVGHHVESVAALLMVLLIWAAIAVINIAHAQRRL
jgi:predicted lipid-binding transport protein (Tim44 family)